MKTYSLIALILITLLISACSAPTPQIVTQNVEITREVTVQVPATVIVKETVIALQTVIVTATPLPPTITPTPTATPEPYQKWTAMQVIDAFKAAGLDAEQPELMTKDDIGLAPYLTDDMIHFFIPSLCADCGGRVYNLATQADADLIKAYYDNLGKSSAAFFSWTFAKDNIVIQLNGDLSEEKAKAYEAALNGLGK